MMMTQVLNQFSKWFLHHQTFAGYVEPIMQVFKPAWRAGQYRAQVVDVKTLHGSFLSVQIKPTKHWPVHIAGQHVSLTVEINGRLLTRVFTIASSQQHFNKSATLRLLIKTNNQGRFTSLLHDELKQGAWCNISAPSGDFVLNNTLNPITFIAGGSGVTPMLAMLDEHLSTLSAQTPSQPKVTLLYYAKTHEHQCIDELNELAAQFSNFTYMILTREQSSDITSNINLEQKPDIYCCGPTDFMKTVEVFAKKHDLNYGQEVFGLEISPLKDNSKFNVKVNNNRYIATANNTLLPQFEEINLPVKRGCGIGICHQCQCIKKSGVVKNLKTGEFSDNGEQLIQLCISQPVSDLELQL